MNKTDIINLALISFSQDIIASFETDTTQEAKLAREIYEPAKRELLVSANWTFAQKNKKLVEAEVSADDIVARYRYCYLLPTDCLKIILLFNNYDSFGKIFNYEIVLNNTTKIFNTNCENACIKYVANIDDISLFDDVFVDAFVKLLAYKLCIALSGQGDMAAMLYQSYIVALNRARTISSSQKREKIPYETDIIKSRG